MTSPPHYRRNFVALLGGSTFFFVGMAFASPTTVLPHLVERLTDSEISVGLLSTVTQGAFFLPQLLFANMLTNKRCKKPYLMLGAAIGRPVYLFYAVALGLGLYRDPALALVLLYGAQIIFFTADALVSLAWIDIVGKVIPGNRRGRLFGAGQLISGLVGIGVGGIIAALLGTGGLPFPTNYAAILGLGGCCFVLSLLSWLFLIELDETVEDTRPTWRDYVPQLVHTLRQDRTFARLVLVRLLTGFDGLALSFYILYATRALGLPPETVGLFSAAQTLGRILAGVGLGALAERAGGHRVVQVATGIGMTAPLLSLALLLTGAQGGAVVAIVFALVFVTIGITISAMMLGFFNYTLELAPASKRPVYIGLLNTLSGTLIVLPTIGGWILRTMSFGVLFVITAVFLVLAHGLSYGLPSARSREMAQQAEPVA